MAATITVKVWRGTPSSGSYWQDYVLSLEPGSTVLSLLYRIREEIDPSLVFPAHFCKLGICGICLMKINGRNALACRYLVTETFLTVEPPMHRRWLRDLLTESVSAPAALGRSTHQSQPKEEIG